MLIIKAFDSGPISLRVTWH